MLKLIGVYAQFLSNFFLIFFDIQPTIIPEYHYSSTNFFMPMLHLSAYNLENKHQVIISTYHSCKFIMCIKYHLTQELNFNVQRIQADQDDKWNI